jgi:hypothetical protein
MCEEDGRQDGRLTGTGTVRSMVVATVRNTQAINSFFFPSKRQM